MNTTTHSTMPYVQQPLLRKQVNDLPAPDQPLTRIGQYGTTAVSTIELIAGIIQTREAVETAEDILIHYRTLRELANAPAEQLAQFRGMSKKQALRLKAAVELGRRALSGDREERPKITSPADAANLLMTEMMLLEQEQLRVIVLNTRNEVLAVEMIYQGSVNTSVVRISEILRPAIQRNAPAIIISHNHPSGQVDPSPEDVNVTRQLVKAGKLMDISVLDHIIIGHNRFTSLKEKSLGFDD